MSISKVISAVKHTFGIPTKAEKVAQTKISQELQAAADKLKGPERDLYVENIKGEINHLKVTDKEVDDINNGHAEILQRAGIRDIESDPNYDRHGLDKIDDIWNPHSRG